jgi:hypothetical protein
MQVGNARRPTTRIAISLLCLVVLAAGCNGAAAQRLKDASRVIALRIGSSSDDVERGFQTRFSTLTETQLADEAEQTVQRTTWLDNAIARIAANRLKTAEAVQRSTCRLLDAYSTLEDLSEARQINEVRAIITDELRAQGLSEGEQNVRSVAQAMVTQIKSLQENGSLDLQSMSSDLFCFMEL